MPPRSKFSPMTQDGPIKVPVNWSPRSYQMNLWKFLERGGKRAVAVWHRRAGKDLLSINWIATQMFQRRGLYWHIFPTYNQGRKIIWQGFTRDGRSFLDAFPESLVVRRNDTEMSLTLKNGSIFQVVGSDNVDRLVGTNPVGCVFSEYSLQDPGVWNLIRPILAENGGWAMFIYTPRGRNHGYDLYQMAKKNDAWFSEVLTVSHTGVVDEAMIAEERATGMPDEMIKQEYYCSFDAPLVGSYYGNLIETLRAEKRFTKVPWEPLVPVTTAWDLGVGDSTSIWFMQQVNNELRLIDYYENSGEGLPHYAKVLQQKDYLYDRHLAPWDIVVRELGTGKSRLEVARQLGIRFTVTRKHTVEDGIEAVRTIFPKLWIDETKCARAFEGLSQYRKDWDEKGKVFRDKPMHDWASHPADALRILAYGIRRDPKKRGPEQRIAIANEHEESYSDIQGRFSQQYSQEIYQ